jgi:hypothetical protein
MLVTLAQEETHLVQVPAGADAAIIVTNVDRKQLAEIRRLDEKLVDGTWARTRRRRCAELPVHPRAGVAAF